MHFADWASLVPATFAVYAVVSARRARPVSFMGRHRHAAMRACGIDRKSSRRRVKAIIQGAPHSAADEINWLATVHPSFHVGPGADVGSSNLVSYSTDRSLLVELSRAYSAYAAALRRGSLLGTTSVPVVGQETEMASLTANLLAEAASGRALGENLQSFTVATPELERELQVLQFPDLATGTLAYDLFVSYRRHRLAPATVVTTSISPASEEPPSLENPGLEEHPLPASPDEVSLLRSKLATQHSFDGVLPRLLGWRTERDESNGRVRIHLALSETTYGAVILDHYPDAFTTRTKRVRHVNGENAKLLTLSSAVVTSDRVLLFAGRSGQAGSHPNQFGPAVNGNLELRTRKGIFGDGDAFGLPDPCKALAREAGEELGLQIDTSSVQVLGLGKFSVGEKERGTHVLMTLVQVDKTAEQIMDGVRDADPMEGRWELGGHLLAAPLPKSEFEVDAALSWLFNDPRLTPHAVLVGAATLSRFFPIDAARIQSAATGPSKNWATSLLALSS